jgi:hypothetical protein
MKMAEETTEAKTRNTACEVRTLNENGDPTGTQECDSQPKARAWIRANGHVGEYEIVRVLEKGIAVQEVTCTLRPLEEEGA